jgi:hypothetical protein
VSPTSGEPFIADLGINYSRVVNRLPQKGGGRIDDLGDMCVTAGKQEIDGRGLECVPGGIIYRPEFTPTRLPSTEQAAELLKEGITTVIGKSDHYVEPPPGSKTPINVCFVDNAADVAKLERGAIKLGAAADLVFLKKGTIEMVMLGGQIVLRGFDLVVDDGGELLRAKGSNAR